MRRNPQQPRAAARRTRFLEVAASLFEQFGFEQVTMTTIAEKAESSIGTLYDYFPDKETLAQTLLTQYTEEASALWIQPLGIQPTPSKADLAELFVEVLLDFAETRPGYLTLLGAPIPHVRSPEVRATGRRAVARGLQNIDPTLTDERGYLIAQVMVELFKGFISVYRQEGPNDRETIAGEFKKLMKFYLTDALAERV